MAYTTIDDPSVYFQTTLYAGDGSTSNAITNAGNSDLQPDWIWGSLRDEDGGARFVFDSSRGTTKRLKTNATTEEQVRSGVTAFNSDGFTVGSHSDSNLNTKSLVAWQWKANGGTTTSTNASGSTGDNTDIIASVRQTNTTAGFSIITYTGDSTAGKKVTHGLGATPEFIIIKNRDNGSEPWAVFTTPTGVKALALNTTAAQATDSGYWSDTNPDSTHFTVGSHGSTGAAAAFVAYAFTSIQGYSKFGSYTGNGNADGPFVYTGFKPAWIMIKRSDNAEGWHILDNKRDFNENNTRLQAETTGVEDTSENGLDMLSNGFKIRTSWAGHNASSGTYIYMTFAEHPFVSSKGVPTTAE